MKWAVIFVGRQIGRVEALSEVGALHRARRDYGKFFTPIRAAQLKVQPVENNPIDEEFYYFTAPNPKDNYKNSSLSLVKKRAQEVANRTGQSVYIMVYQFGMIEDETIIEPIQDHMQPMKRNPKKPKKNPRLDADIKITTSDIREALKAPRDFGYTGNNEEMFKTWSLGPVIRTRDSDVIERANADSLEEYLQSDSSLDALWEITGARHWAVGWVDHLSFQVIDEDGEPTRIFRVVKKWFEDLEDQPVADEDKLSEIEMEQEGEDWEGWGRSDWVRALTSAFDEEWEDSIESAESDQIDELWYRASQKLGWTVEFDDGGSVFNFKEGKKKITEDDLIDVLGRPGSN